jgi:hypothetical protein
MQSGPGKIVFVGGAPRSGTTVTHALICTSNSVSEYHPEISFLRGVISAFSLGRAAWQAHTSAFFDDAESFRAHMRRTADLTMIHVWERLGRAPILSLKDPHLTPLFPALAALYPQEGLFVTVCRHPFDVIRSREEVHAKSQPQAPFAAADAAAVAREYLQYYRAVLTHDFGGRHFAFRYEDLNEARLQEGLARFVGVDDFNARPMWGKPPDVSGDPWGSPKYHKAIDLEPRLSPLKPEFQEIARTICGPVMQRFGYD